MRIKGSHVLNYILSALFLLAFSLKDLHPLLSHHHPEEICTESRLHYHDAELDQECFICDLYISINATSNKILFNIALPPVIVYTVIPDDNFLILFQDKNVPARAPPAVIEA